MLTQVARSLAQAQLGQWFSASAQALPTNPVALRHQEVLVVALAVASAVALGPWAVLRTVARRMWSHIR